MINKLKISVFVLIIFLLILIVGLSVKQKKYSFSGLIIGDSYDTKVIGQVVIPNAKIIAINQDNFKVTRMSYVTHSDNKGSFEFKNLLPGHYQIMFSSDGKAPAIYYNFDEMPPTFVTLKKGYSQRQPFLLTLKLGSRAMDDLHKETALTTLIKALEEYKKANGSYPLSNSDSNYMKLVGDSTIIEKLAKYIPNGTEILPDSPPIEYQSSGLSYFLRATNINFPERKSVYLSAYPEQGIGYYFTNNIHN